MLYSLTLHPQLEWAGKAQVTRTLIENSRIWQGDHFISGHTLIIADGIIRDLRPASEVEALPGDRRMNGGGGYAIPGFVDLHVHGSNDYDVMDASQASLQGLCDFLVRQGVTSFLGTTMSDSAARIEAALGTLRDFVNRPHSPFLGVHLEGTLPQPGLPRLPTGDTSSSAVARRILALAQVRTYQADHYGAGTRRWRQIDSRGH